MLSMAEKKKKELELPEVGGLRSHYSAFWTLTPPELLSLVLILFFLFFYIN
jgi:hypothetical protein